MTTRTLNALASTVFCFFMLAEPSFSKTACDAVWQRIAEMEKNKQYAVIKMDDKTDISNGDIKKKFGEPQAIDHIQVMHPPTTASIWRYKRPSGTLEFRFFNSTKHVNQIELKANAQPAAK